MTTCFKFCFCSCTISGANFTKKWDANALVRHDCFNAPLLETSDAMALTEGRRATLQRQELLWWKSNTQEYTRMLLTYHVRCLPVCSRWTLWKFWMHDCVFTYCVCFGSICHIVTAGCKHVRTFVNYCQTMFEPRRMDENTHIFSKSSTRSDKKLQCSAWMWRFAISHRMPKFFSHSTENILVNYLAIYHFVFLSYIASLSRYL